MIQSFFHDGNKHINGDGNPNLGLHRILRRPVKRLDPQMLFDPPKEQLDLPATFVELSNGQRGKNNIIGQKGQMLVLIPVEKADTAQLLRVVFGRVDPCQNDPLI